MPNVSRAGPRAEVGPLTGRQGEPQSSNADVPAV